MISFFVFIIVVLAAASGAFWRWQKKVKAEIDEGAAFEWAHFQKVEPDFVVGLNEEEFRGIYARVHTPRFPGYALAAFATFLVSLPVIFIALTLTLWGAQKAGLTPEPAEVADRLLLEDGEVRFFKQTPPEAALYYVEDLAGFYYFFGVLVVWLLIVAFYMHRYHKHRPGYLRDEIIRIRH